jgi:hypothetical protein
MLFFSWNLYCAQKELYSVKLEWMFQITVHTADQDDDAQDDESHGLHAGQAFCFFVPFHSRLSL